MKRITASLAAAMVLACCGLLASPGLVWGQAVSEPGEIESVTVYRGQAMVTRSLSVKGLEGRQEVVFTDLPAQVIAGSVAAEAGPGVEVGFTRYRARPVAQDVRQEVRALDDKIDAIRVELDRVAAQQGLVKHARDYLGKLEGFTATNAKAELANGVLDADTLQTLSDYLLSKRAELTDRNLELQQENKALKERLNLLQRERNKLTGSSSRTLREAVVSLNVVAPGPDAAVRLRYLVNNATWSPSYSVRATDGGDTVRVDYHASIQQVTGENWDGVAMTLSTATPTLTAEAPELASLVLQLTRGGNAQQLAQNLGYSNIQEAQLKNSDRQMRAAEQRDLAATMGINQSSSGALFSDSDMSQQPTYDDRLNTFAGNAQALELLAEKVQDGKGIAATTRSLSTRDEGSLSVAYTLDGRTSLPSRSDRQLVRIRSLELAAETYLTAVPVLTSKVYREASLVNDSGIVLLAGPMASYLDGQFVGRGQMPSVFEGERFEVGLGVDPTLRAAREVVERKEDVQGGNRVLDVTYALRLMNFSGEASGVRLLGRMPVTDNDQAVKITLAEPGQPLSDAATYTQAMRDGGILRWDVAVPAGATGDEAFELQYRVTIEHDKQLTFGNVKTR